MIVRAGAERPRILLVDDEAPMRAVMRRVIAVAFPQAELCEASDGGAALEILDERVICVVADVMMPGMDGFEMCWWIRHGLALRPFSDVPVILVSAVERGEAFLTRAWQVGTALVLEKPFRMQELRGLVAKVSGVPCARRPDVDPGHVARGRTARALLPARVLTREELELICELSASQIA